MTKQNINYKALLLIFFSSIILGLVYNTFSIDGIPFIREPIIVNSVKLDSLDNTSENLRELTLAQVIEMTNAPNTKLVDARDEWDFAAGHIKGAINIPEYNFDYSNKSLSEINKKAFLIIYCDSNDCDISKRLAVKLLEIGYRNVFVYLGGYSEWDNASLPISRNNNSE